MSTLDHIQPLSSAMHEVELEGKEAPYDSKPGSTFEGSEDEDRPALPSGVANVEAGQRLGGWVSARYIIYAGLVLATYIQSLDSSTTYQFTAYATSEVLAHSLSGTVQTTSGIVYAVIYPLMGRLCDVFGRGETYVLSTIMYIIGYVLIATASSIGQIAGGTIFSSIAGGGLNILFAVVFADITTIRWRPFSMAIVNLPYLINVFVASEIVNAILPGPGWRWGYGIFIILTPVFLIPVAGSLLWTSHKAKKLAPPRPSTPSRTPVRAALDMVEKLDLVGLVLCSASFALILLPLTLASEASQGWKTPSIIVEVVVGVLLFPCFVLWETKMAKFPMASLKLLKNRNVLASIGVGFWTNVSYSLLDTYQYSFVYIVKTEWNERIISYFSSTQTIGLAVFGVISGMICAYTRRFKWLLVAGLTIRLIGCGVMIHARGGLGSDFELVATQLIQAIGAGLSQTDLAAQASVTHANVASVIALLYLCSTVGGSIGSAIATSVWTNTMPGRLAHHITSVNETVLGELYADITLIHDYDAESLVRVGALEAYSDVMKILCIAGTCCALPPILFAIWGVQNIHLADVQNIVEGRNLAGEKTGEGQEDEKAAAAQGTV